MSVRSRQLEGIHLQLITQKKKKNKMADTELAQVYKKTKQKPESLTSQHPHEQKASEKKPDNVTSVPQRQKVKKEKQTGIPVRPLTLATPPNT